LSQSAYYEKVVVRHLAFAIRTSIMIVAFTLMAKLRRNHYLKLIFNPLTNKVI